jgi:RNA polymerase sigma-70 factor (ECF subfamily)
VTSDSDLVREQFRTVFRAHSQRLHSVALRRTGNRATAESLVGDVFEDAWKQRETFLLLPESEQVNWLFRVIHNKIADSFRLGAGRFERLYAEPNFSMDQRPAPRSSTPRQALLQEILGRCWDMIKDMPEVRRTVFFLRAAEWTTGEIAKELGISASTVRSHLQHGRKQFEEKIGPAAEIFTDLEDENEDGTQR